MRTSSLLVAAILAVVMTCAMGAESVFKRNIVETVNTSPNVAWKAGHNKYSALSLKEIKKMLIPNFQERKRYSDKQMAIIKQFQASAKADKANPVEFDSRITWPNCVHAIRNQEKCGSCWAFAASEAFSDRFCIASNGTINMVFSPQDMVSCDKRNKGCDGGMMGAVWEYMATSGVVPDWCFPYASQNGTSPSCPSTCIDGRTNFNSVKYKLKSYHKVSPFIMFWRREIDIENALISGGPLEAAFTVYEDFMHYSSGVYHHVTGAALGGHAVKIVGYGVDSASGMKYWIIANSWGPEWGLDGFFWIAKGKDECGIEMDVWGGEPDVDRAPKL